MVAKANLFIGNGTAGTAAFSSVGTLDVGNYEVDIFASSAILVGNVEIGGGKLSSGAKLTQQVGQTLEGDGDVVAVWDGKGTIDATGDLSIGEGSTGSAFLHTGTLKVNSASVTLQSATTQV